MTPLCAAQIKAARAYLGWSQDDLSREASLSVATIRNLELGNISYRSLTSVRRALETAGIEFTEQEGLRLRSNDITILRGTDSCKQFYDDILQTLKTKGGDVACVIKSQEELFEILGDSPKDRTDRLGQIAQYGTIRCLLSDFLEPRIVLPKFEFRAISRHYAGPVSYYVYGGCHALALKEGGSDQFKFVIFRSLDLALSYREHFFDLWDIASSYNKAPQGMPVHAVR